MTAGMQTPHLRLRAAPPYRPCRTAERRRSDAAARRADAPHQPAARRLLAAAESQAAQSSAAGGEDEMSDKVEEFLRKQAEKESGTPAIPDERPQEVLGSDVVSDQDAKRYCREVMSAVKQLRQSRDMSVSEIKLTLAIEDPTDREKRDYLGIEEGEGLSRDEIAAALMEVVAGRIPLDRLALRELHRELTAWPFLDSVQELQAEQQLDSNYGGVTDTGLQKGRGPSEGWREGQARPPVGRDKGEAPQGLVDMLPDWMGYGFLYFVSVIPVLIVIATIAILFFSSLK